LDKAYNEILSKIPSVYATALQKCNFFDLQEIRFRTGRAVMLYKREGVSYLSKEDGMTRNKECALYATAEDISQIVRAFCKNSVYAYQEEIKEGYITIKGGHRVGISGTAVADKGNVTNMKYLSGLNIRIAREYKGSASHLLGHILDGTRIYNSIIISPPGVGKTTILRDLARQLSNRFKVSLVDERSELAAMHMGVPQFDVGEQTDVLDAFPKATGMIHALRSLSPDVIITDEIGTEEDICAVKSLLKGGCKIVTSMHGYSIEEAMHNKKELMELFETAILLERKNGIPEVRTCLKL